MTRGAVVLTYHRIVEGPDPLLQCVTPERFRDQLRCIADIADVVPLRAVGRARRRPQVAITFDDGYADNATTAAPILRETQTPATFFVPSRVVDDDAEHWWDVVEHLHEVDAPVDTVELVAGGRSVRVDVRSPAGRARALKVVTKRLRSLPMTEIVPAVDAVARQLGADPRPRCDRHALLSGDDVAALAADPLFEIGSHGIAHTMLSVLPVPAQAEELTASRRRLREAAGRPITSLAYPYGTPGSFTAETLRQVRLAGYQRAYVNTPGRMSRRRSLTCPRFMVYDWPGDELAGHLASWLRN